MTNAKKHHKIAKSISITTRQLNSVKLAEFKTVHSVLTKRIASTATKDIPC